MATKLAKYITQVHVGAEEGLLAIAILQGLHAYFDGDDYSQQPLYAELQANLQFAIFFYGEDSSYLTYQNDNVIFIGPIKLGSLITQRMDNYRVYKDLVQQFVTH